MTRDDIVTDVMERLNLTSTDARNRIERRIQDRYARITSSCGLITSRRATETATIDPVTMTTLPDFHVDDMEKVTRVVLISDNPRKMNMDEVSYDEVTRFSLGAGLPHKWAVKDMGSSSVTITFDRFPTTDPFTVTIYGYTNILQLSGDDEPVFPADFHDILVTGGLADELMKMEKPALAQVRESQYEGRLSDLRLFIAKSGFMDIYQGKTKPSQRYYWPWDARIFVE